MNLYGFLASVVGSVAWPVTIVFCVLFLSKNGRNILKFVKTIRYGDLELTLQDARRDAEAIQIETGQPARPATEADDKILRLAEINPPAAVIEIWKSLEAKLIQLIQHNGMIRFTRPEHFMKVLVDQKRISATELELFQRLRKIRNDSVHSRDPRALTVAEVLDYKSFVETLVTRLDQIMREPGYIRVPMPPADGNSPTSG